MKSVFCYRRMLFVALAGLMISIIGCATSTGTVTNHENDLVRQVAPQYPSSRFIVGYGVSDSGRAAAELEARARVSEQIESSIESEFSQFVSSRSSSVNGRSQDIQDVSIRTKSTSKFSRAELIRVLPAFTRCDGSGCFAVAVLERDRAGAALAGDYTIQAGEFRRLAAAAIECAATSGNLSVTAARIADFAAVHNPARRAFDKLIALNAQAAAIKRPISDFDSDVAILDRLGMARTSIVSGLSISVVPGTGSDAAHVADVIVKSLAGLGFRASGQNQCKSGLLLKPTAAVDCRPGHMGTVCAPRISLDISNCPEGQHLGSVGLTDIGVVGTSVRDSRTARGQVLSGLKPDVITGVLRTAVHEYLPMP